MTDMIFGLEETEACRRLLELAWMEDLDDQGDVTSQAVIREDARGEAVLVARQSGVLAGLPAAELVFATLDATIRWQTYQTEATAIQAGDQLARVVGPLRSILTGERTALNFIQHLSGIASLTRRYVEAVAGLPCQILDTRKTLPGWRVLAKYAVRCGGGQNHRRGLYDGILIKDNHLAGLGSVSFHQQIEEALRRVRDWRQLSPNESRQRLPLEIEVDTLDQLDVALRCQPDIILLDNMNLDELREAVTRRNRLVPGVLLEASGGITLDNVRSVAMTGVERISIGALTHSASALDIGLDYLS
ncbi:MAG: carboxylating nicotinate-nucleotide diphosphorylase [Gemmataceae bacterium]